jgi:DnaK suppressor protein
MTKVATKPSTRTKAEERKAKPVRGNAAVATDKAGAKRVATASAAKPKKKAVAESKSSKVMPAPKPAPVGVVPVVPKKDKRLADHWKKKRVEDLVDDEVLSMPDEEYMDPTQLAFFRLKLTRLRDDILSNADKTTARLRKDTVVVPDPADRATIEEEHALELRTRDRERKLLKKIEQSITRIDSGDYGYCDETGEPIGVARLLARPTATLSLEAQQRRELKQKMFGD